MARAAVANTQAGSGTHSYPSARVPLAVQYNFALLLRSLQWPLHCTRIFVRFAHVYFCVLPFSFLSYYRTHAHTHTQRRPFRLCAFGFFCAALLLFIVIAQFLLCSFYFVFFLSYFSLQFFRVIFIACVSEWKNKMKRKITFVQYDAKNGKCENAARLHAASIYNFGEAWRGRWVRAVKSEQKEKEMPKL